MLEAPAIVRAAKVNVNPLNQIWYRYGGTYNPGPFPLSPTFFTSPKLHVFTLPISCTMSEESVNINPSCGGSRHSVFSM